MDIGAYDLEDELWQQTAADGIARSAVYQPDGVRVVLGRGSKVDVELERERCIADGVVVERRRGGGCAVVLDPGNIIVAVSLPVEGFGQNLAHFERLNKRVIDGLAELGLDGVYQDGVSDLVHDDQKIGGTCIYRARGVLHYAASLLVEPELELIDRYLRHPPREPDYRRQRKHREFVKPLSSIAGAPSYARIFEQLGTVFRFSANARPF